MGDTIIERPSPTPIPVLSPALHCVAMTALVYLRTSFGYTFLRPKSVFFAFSWAFVLFVIMAWNEPNVWREYHAACIFGTGAVVLYWMHLLRTFFFEWRKNAEDDHYPGTSHALRISRLFGLRDASGEMLRFWIEPAAVFAASATLRFVFAERHLSAWLFFVALCMIGRESINHWIDARRGKIVGETIRKAKEQGDALADEQPPAPAPKPTREEPVKRKRNTGTAAEADPQTRFAKILRLHPPYTLAKAEENFRTLILLEHPDIHENSPESNTATADLTEAIKFFRERLSG